MNAVTDLPRLVSQDTILEMAQEKLLEDAEKFSEWLYAETLAPGERRPSSYFAPISTHALLVDILMKKRATREQLAEGWLEVRRRYLEDHHSEVCEEFARLLSEES